MHPKLNINKKPTVWVINQFAGTLESGWGERHYYLSKHWINNGYNVRIISGSFNHMFKVNKKVNNLFEEENFNDVNFTWIKTPKYDAKSWKRFFSMLIFSIRVLILPVKKLGAPNIIIVSSMPIFPILSAIIMRYYLKCKVIFEIRDIWPLTLQLLGNKPNWHPAVKFIGWFEKLGYQKSDVIVSLLPNARKHIETIARQKVDFQYIPNGVDPVNTLQESIPEELKVKIPKDKFIVGYAGTLGLANALEHFIEASTKLEKINDIFFVIVGDGYLKEELINKTIGQENILFYPKIRKSQVQHLLSHFNVCFVGRNDSPLFQHGVSANKYFEYMLAGKPILDSNNHIKDPVELSGCGIIVKPDSVDAICDGVMKFYKLTKSERDKMGALGKDYVIKYHDFHYLSNKYSNLFKNLLI